MKFTIEKNALLAAISIVSKALPSHTPTPILEGILLQAKDGSLRLLCSDSSLQIETTVPADVLEIGETVIPGKLFNEIVRKLPEGEVEIEVREKDTKISAFISCGASKTNIQCIDATFFPEMPLMSAIKTITIKQTVLRDMIRQTAFATALDEARPILTGVLFETKENVLTLVALDGYRLAIRREECIAQGDVNAVVPASSLNEMIKILGDEDTDIVVSLSHSNIMIDLSHTRINAVLLTGEFMKYASIIPKEHIGCMRVDRRELLFAIERASLMARESKNNLVRFNIDQEMLSISSNSEIGNVYDQIPISLTGSDLEIAFNAKYMIDVLSKLEDEVIQLLFNTNISPCMIEPVQGNAYLYLVLPVRIFSK